MASTRAAQRRACWATNGSFIRINAWAGTFDTSRRPAVTSGGGMSKATSIGVRKFRRTLR